MSLDAIPSEDVQIGRSRTKNAANNHVGKEVVIDHIKMISFDKPLTYSDVKYKLLKVGVWNNHMPKPTTLVGIDGAIDLTITDKKDGQVFKSIIYYTPDLQIRNGLQSFFPKYITGISDLRDNDLINLNEDQFEKYIKGDNVRFFIDPNDKTKIFVEYIKNERVIEAQPVVDTKIQPVVKDVIMITKTNNELKDDRKKKCKELNFVKKILVMSDIPEENNWGSARLYSLKKIFPDIPGLGEHITVVDCETGEKYDAKMHDYTGGLISAGLSDLWHYDNRHKKFHVRDTIGVALDPEDNHILYVCFKYQDIKNIKEDIKNIKEDIKEEERGIIMTEEMEELLENKKQIILYGPPGTGKTYGARKLAERFIKGEFNDLKDKGFIEFIAFHPSYGYEEFIERITVPIEKEEELTESGKYELKAGIFKNLCKRALIYSIDRDFQVELQEKIIDKNSRIYYRTKKEQISTIIEKGKFNDVSWRQIYDTYKKAKSEKKVNFISTPKFVLIIDEINRGYISKIFGELITLIEKDKRIGEDNELTASLLYSVDKFGVPPNVYIIGTMNTADRSIDLVDIALRRRFGFIEMLPDFSIVENDIKEREEDLKSEGIYQLLLDSKSALERINQRICNDEIGRDRQIGHSFILQIKTKNELIMAWQYNILPLIDEYCQGDCEKVNQILFLKDNTNWITEKDGIYKFKGDLTKLGDFINQII